MREFRLGRKRLLDTLLAATYFSHGVCTVVSSNACGYSIFGCFDVIIPESGARRRETGLAGDPRQES
jgi:hypothetical protein